MKRLVVVLCLCAGCASGPSPDTMDRAYTIAKRYPIIDTHIDVPYRLENQWADVTKATDDGDFDYPRAVAGGLDAPFMSIYVPASLEETGGGRQLADQLIDSVEALVGRAPAKFALATSPDDVLVNFDKGLISLPLGMENGTPIEGDLANLEHFHARGIRYITLAHSKSNHISDSSYDENRQWSGLSPFGERVVARMNELGIMIDISHLSDEAVRDVLRISSVPVLATHSSARKFTPDWERNMSDELIREMAAADGVIQINFGSAFLTRTALAYSQARSDARDAFKEEQGLDDEHPRIDAWNEAYREQNPYPYATVDDVLDHIDHVVGLVGIEHVGIGSDYDGVGDSLPVGLKDVSTFPNLIAGLLERGYSENDITAILYRNTLRVWRAAEDYARDN